MTTKKVTTLQSATGVSSPIMIECRDDVVHFTAWTSAETNRAWANPKRADVLAALGIDELGCGCDEADDNLKKALARAEEAETKLAEAERSLTELAPLRDERVIAWEAVAKHEAIQPCYDEDRPLLPAVLDRLGRLAEAEVTIERVWSVLGNANADDCKVSFYNKLHRALTQKPAFELPTEAGAVIFATVDETGQEHELHLYRDGKWRDDTETWYWPKDVLTDFTDHRLAGGAE